MFVRDVIDAIDKRSPFAEACDWDNVGLLVGSCDSSATHIHVALDATDEVIDNAIKLGADVIVTHHPMIFSPVKSVRADDFTGRRIIRLIENNISYIAMHTNYDIYGMADLAAKMLSLNDCVPLEAASEDGKCGIGRVGKLSAQTTLKSFAQDVKKIFGLSFVNYFGDDDKEIGRVACCPGSGKGDIANALKAGADVFVTGDIDHHSGIDALAQGMAIIDAGHYGIEHIFIEDEARRLKADLKGAINITTEKFNEPIKAV